MATPHKEQKLAIRLPNWLGDTLMAYPLLSALSKAGVDFTCFGHAWAADIFSATDFSVVADARIRSKLWLARQYRSGAFSRVLLCPSSWSAVIPALLARLPATGDHKLCSPRVLRPEGTHRVDQYFELGRDLLPPQASPNRTDAFIPISPESESAAERLLAERAEGPFVAICPYATNRHNGLNKEWPHWRDFIEGRGGTALLGLVAPEDKQRFEAEHPGTAVISTSLTVTAAIMRRAEHVVTNDSGAMHLASFFGANVVGLMGITDHCLTQPWFGAYLTGKDEPWASLDDLAAHLSNS